MKCINWNELEWDEVMPGMKRKVQHAGAFTMVLVELAPNLNVPVHAHPHEQATLVQEGLLHFSVQGETRLVGPGDVIRIPPDAEHGVVVQDQPARLIDIFAPPRGEFPASGLKE